ncbi:hypothetical protein ACOSQ4_022343 [Xanthoceras sorbifolium]
MLQGLTASSNVLPWRDIKEVERELDTLLAREDTCWKQHSRVSWLQNGDRNTHFFHSQASKRKQINKIYWLFDSNGRWTEEMTGTKDIIVSYFVDIFTSDQPFRRDIDEVLEIVGQRISQQAVRFLDMANALAKAAHFLDYGCFWSESSTPDVEWLVREDFPG